jgi:hypothetical protein
MTLDAPAAFFDAAAAGYGAALLEKAPRGEFGARVFIGWPADSHCAIVFGPLLA